MHSGQSTLGQLVANAPASCGKKHTDFIAPLVHAKTRAKHVGGHTLRAGQGKTGKIPLVIIVKTLFHAIELEYDQAEAQTVQRNALAFELARIFQHGAKAADLVFHFRKQGGLIEQAAAGLVV